MTFKIPLSDVAEPLFKINDIRLKKTWKLNGFCDLDHGYAYEK